MNPLNKYVGLEVHKETITVAVAESNGGEVRDEHLQSTASASVFWPAIGSADGVARGESNHRPDDRGRDGRLEALCQCPTTDGLSGRGAQ